MSEILTPSKNNFSGPSEELNPEPLNFDIDEVFSHIFKNNSFSFVVVFQVI